MHVFCYITDKYDKVGINHSIVNTFTKYLHIYGHQRCPYIRLSRPTTPLFGQNLGRGSLKWHRSGKSGGYFEALDYLYAPCEFKQNRPKDLREIRDRAKIFFSFFLFMGTYHIFVCRGQKGRGFAGFWLITPSNWVT